MFLQILFGLLFLYLLYLLFSDPDTPERLGESHLLRAWAPPRKGRPSWAFWPRGQRKYRRLRRPPD